MRQINFFILGIAFLIGSDSFSQETKCDIRQVLDNIILEDISYRRMERDTINLENALGEYKSGFLGFRGVNKKRLAIVFSSIEIYQNDPNCYAVNGYTTVMDKNERRFEGEFHLKSNFIFPEPVFEDSSDPYGFSVLEYHLLEDKTASATGIFEGSLILLWKVDVSKDVVVYDDIFDGYDGARNYQFFGFWTSYKTGKSSLSCWGIDRIPCSGNLDIGAGEFSPNPEYYKFGWKK